MRNSPKNYFLPARIPALLAENELLRAILRRYLATARAGYLEEDLADIDASARTILAEARP
jgi:hypothetical protein